MNAKNINTLTLILIFLHFASTQFTAPDQSVLYTATKDIIMDGQELTLNWNDITITLPAAISNPSLCMSK